MEWIGARQVGKSTMLRSLLPEGMRYVTLDHELMRMRAGEDPMGFLEEMGSPLCIDEVQYEPRLLRAIKMRVDVTGEPGQYWLTGSQRFHLMQGVSESLAGRFKWCGYDSCSSGGAGATGYCALHGYGDSAAG